MHPYHSWNETGQGPSSSWPHSPPPSILGALPYPTISHATTLVTYHITSYGPYILNSSVIGPDGRTYATIGPERDMPGYTAIKDAQNHSIALIEWTSTPEVQIRDFLAKKPVRSWLRLTPDRSARTMEVRGVNYIWAPHNQSINLHAGDLNRTFLANVSRTQNSTAVQITSDAITQRLLESVIVAAVLLQCGRNID